MAKKKTPARALASFDDLDAVGLGTGYIPPSVEAEKQAEPEAPKPRGLGGFAKDFGISALKGAIGVPEAAIGLADLVTGGRAGQLAEEVGFRPKEAKAMLDEGYSDPQKQAFREVQAAKGLGDTFMAAVRNPSVIAQSVVESLPSMGAGGVVARGGLALAPKLGGVVAGAMGEGIVGAGAAAEQIRQQTPDGLLTGAQAGLAGATGLATGAFSVLGGKIAQKLGIADVDTMLAGAAANPAARKGVVRSALEGAFSEGILEELPQSVAEQVLQNQALGRPLDEGVNQAAVLGTLGGSAMGAGANVASSFRSQPPAPEPVTPAVAPIIEAPAGPLGRAANLSTPPAPPPLPEQAPAMVDPVAERINSLPDTIRDEAAAAYALINNPETPKAALKLNSKILDDHLATLTAQEEQAPEPVMPIEPQPSDRMPVDDMPYSNAAVAEVMNDNGDGTKKGTVVAVEGGFVIRPTASTATTPKAPKGQFTTAQEASDYIKTQRQSASIKLPAALTIEYPDNTFGIATAGSPDFAEAQRQEGARNLLAAGVQEGDLLNVQNEPFTMRQPADRLAKETGGELVELSTSTQGKRRYVVRPIPKDANVSTTPAVSGVPAAADGRGGDQPASGVAVGVGAGTTAGPALDAGGVRSEPAGVPVSLPASQSGAVKLPTALTGAAPRYSYGPKQFTLTFASDLDRAAYITAQDKPSKRDTDFMQFAMGASGMTEPEVRAYGQQVRGRIKALAKDAEPGDLQVPTTSTTSKPNNVQNTPPAARPAQTETASAETPEAGAPAAAGPAAAGPTAGAGDVQAAGVAGQQISKDWTAFAPTSGTLNVPRADMPQVKAENRGALVGYLKGQGITSDAATDVSAASLKPTQAEFSPAKVQRAKTFDGNRSILVSSDNYVVDGHHQWLAKFEQGQAVKVLRLNAPIEQLLRTIKEFPSAEQASGAIAATVPGPNSQPQADQPQLTSPQKQEPTAAADYSGKWFGSQDKAQAFVDQQTISGSHEVTAKGKRWIVSQKKQSVAQADIADVATENVAKPKTKTQLARADVLQKRADYFTPGNIVKGYDGHDEVISYSPPADGKPWGVTVRAVVQKDGQWVPDPKDNRTRQHATEPDKKQLMAGPVKRMQAPAQDAEDDGKAEATAKASEASKTPAAPVEVEALNPAGPAAAEPEVDASQGIDDANDAPGQQNGSTDAPKPASTKIEDSGAVLEGARKLYAKAYADKLAEGVGMDTATVPLSKSWPEPDYQRMLDDGAVPWAVAAARAMRDEIPTKPSSWKLKGWVKNVEALRAMAAQVVEGDITQENFADRAATYQLAEWLNKIDLYEAVGHAKSLKNVRFRSGSYDLYGGKTFAPAKRLWTVNAPNTSSTATWSRGNWGSDLVVADTKAEAIEKFKAWTAAQGDAAPVEAKATTFDIYSYRGKPGFIVGKRLGASKSIDLKTFPTAKEAREYKAANQAELEKLLEAAKVVPPERRETNAPRIGVDHRNGADVTTEQFRDTFGFRGEQFGASMPQAERQANMNQAYDALMDMAGVVGIAPRALSLNGELGLAFGARGHGGKNPAAAHYERDTTGAVTPNRVVINLTRKNGAGSLAHEWFHAVDNYFARARGEKGGMLTEQPYERGAGVRPEMVAAFKGLMAAINTSSLRERSKNLDKRRTKDYWSTGLEMAARSFESYVIAKLHDQNAANDYLANIVSEQEFSTENGYPYPTAGELPQIRAAFDHFFGTVQTREDDAGNVAMFSRTSATPEVDEKQARAKQVSVQQYVDGITERWANAPEVIVARDINDTVLPEQIRQANDTMNSNGAEGSPEGVFFRGKVYIIADQIGSQTQAFRVLAHEALGHFGLRGTFGTSLDGIKQQIIATRRKEVLAKAKDYGLDASNPRSLMYAAEEVLAEMAQTTPNIGFVQRAVAAIRTWLRANAPGFKDLALTDDEIIRSYILPARGWVVRGQTEPTPQGDMAFARGTNDAVTAFNNASGNYNPELDAFWLKKGAQEINGEGMPDDEYHQAVAEYANAWRIDELLEKLGWNRRGSSNISSSRYYAKTIGNEETGDDRTYEVRVSDHDDYHPEDSEVNQRFQVNFRQNVGQWSDADIGPDLSNTEVTARLNDILPNESTAPNSGGDAMFSRTLADTVSTALNSAKDVKLPAGYLVGDFFNGNGKLSWWHKSVGTMYNLAQRNPAFKRVYDEVQGFLNDVSFYATESADLAPNILPKLDTWKDITKTALSPEDSKAIATPIFEGTLVWGRDRAGKPVKMEVLEEEAANLSAQQKATEMLRADKITEQVLKMWQGMPVAQYETMVNSRYASQMLQAGIVFTPGELKSLFNLSDKQAALYREFRTATDASLTSLAISDMVRYGGKDVESIKDQAMLASTVEDASTMLRDYLMTLATGSDRKDVLLDMAETMIDKSDKARSLMDKGYAPLSRFGTKTVDVVDTQGERVYFGLFESDADAGRMARRMALAYPGAAITRGTTSDAAYKLFAGVSPETLELFGGMLGLESQGDDASAKAFQEYLKLAKSSRSAMKRLIQRKGIAGFSEDPGRVLAGFIYSNARQTAGSLHQGQIAEAVNDIPQGQGELKDAAIGLQDYIKNPQEEAQAFRGLLFAQYLGGSVASAMVNMTQPLTVTFPYLSQFGGVTKAAGQMRRAAADVMKKTTGDKDLDAALKLAEEQGIVAPQEVHQLMAQANGSGGLRSGDGTTAGNAAATANNALSKLTLVWGKLFSSAEQFNRRLTFIAAYRIAVEQGMANPAAFATKTIAETQFTYNKGSKPRWARGAIGGVLFTFKQYSINYLELASRMATQGGPEGRKAALLMVGVLLLMGGAGGLPFAEDADDLVDGIMQRLGYNFSAKQKRNEFIGSILGQDAARFLDSGVSGLPGVPIDLSGRMGMGNLIPGTGLFAKKNDYTRDVVEFVGPAGDLVRRGFQSANALAAGEVGKAATLLLPTAASNLVKAVDMASTGIYKDVRGRKVIDVDGYDALAKGIGFQPNDVARVQDSTRTVQNLISQNKIREAEIADKWALGLFEQDPDKVSAARDMLKDWNEKNPTAPIRVQMPQIIKRVRAMRESKQERIKKTSPKEIRAAVQRELSAQP